MALGITLVVMGLVARTLQDVARIFRAQSDLAEASSSITRALDDICYELTLAGQGLGEGVVAVMPRLPSGEVSASALTVRSNPNVTAGYLTLGLVETDTELAFTGADAFESGETVLLTDARRSNEVAEVVKRSALWMELRSLETTSGDFRHRFTQGAATRALGLREVRYYLRASGDGEATELVKDVTGVTSRVLARDIIALTFEYLDANGKVITATKVEDEYSDLETIRVKLRYSAKTGAFEPLSIMTAVSLRAASGTVDFERPDLGFRLSRMMYPLDHPIAVVSRPAADRGAVVAAGTNPRQDPSYVYTFQMEQPFMGANVDSVAFLDDVRGPVAAVLGPERGPLAGSLFVAAAGLRIGHITRMLPDENGDFSSASEVIAFDGTDAIAQAGGMAFGVEGALYVMSQEKGAIYRYRFDGEGKPGKPERLFGVTGTPGPVVQGSDGHLYFLMQHGGQRARPWYRRERGRCRLRSRRKQRSSRLFAARPGGPHRRTACLRRAPRGRAAITRRFRNGQGSDIRRSARANETARLRRARRSVQPCHGNDAPESNLRSALGGGARRRSDVGVGRRGSRGSEAAGDDAELFRAWDNPCQALRDSARSRKRRDGHGVSSP